MWSNASSFYRFVSIVCWPRVSKTLIFFARIYFQFSWFISSPCITNISSCMLSLSSFDISTFRLRWITIRYVVCNDVTMSMRETDHSRAVSRRSEVYQLSQWTGNSSSPVWEVRVDRLWHSVAACCRRHHCSLDAITNTERQPTSWTQKRIPLPYASAYQYFCVYTLQFTTI